jgi:predicted N-acyltransferase
MFRSENPFIQHAFLLALEESGCVSAKTGWQAQHVMLLDKERPLAVMPLYSKTHSYGEFVFDWGWAAAYERHGLDYYPKLITAIPFSPVAGPRIGISSGTETGEVVGALLDAVHEFADTHACSSWHLLFPGKRLQQELANTCDEGTFLLREAVQFYWVNRDYPNFDGFLSTLRSARRKNLKRERRMVTDQGINLERKTGEEISDDEWQGFYHCYINTYRKRSGHDGYLNFDFFNRLRETMAAQLMLVVARREEQIIACSLFMFDSKRLYGRYWGALEDISCLHFEACFYQGIEFCIEHGLREFDPGTQGEHKLMRGFEPVMSASYHWIADERFRLAIADFLNHEKHHTSEYQQHARTYLPYKKTDT